jgi:putative MATE family efflux protein
MFSRKLLRDLARIAVPQALQMLLFTSMVLVDAVMLGQLGEHEVGAAGLADRAMFVVLLIVFGAGNAGGVLAAQYWGAGDGAGLRRVTALATLMTTGIGLLATGFFACASHWVIALGSNDPQVVRLGGDYLAIVGLSMVGGGILVPLDAALRTVDRAGIPTRYGLVETALNVGLNYGLIFGNFGLPAMGMEGAAWGSLIARGTRVVLLVAHVRWFEPEVAYGLAELRACLAKDQLRRYLTLAIPLVVNLFVFASGVFVLQLIYGRMGVAELAVTTVLGTFQRFVIAISTAVAGASAILVGRSIGANQPEAAIATAFHSARVALGVGLLVALALVVTQNGLLGLFSGIDSKTMALTRTVFPLMVLDVVVRSVNIVIIVGGLKAGGDVRFCLGLDFFCAWVLAIPLAALGAFEWQLGLLTVYALAMTEEAVKLGLGLRRLRRRRWMKKLIEDELPVSERPQVATS